MATTATPVQLKTLLCSLCQNKMLSTIPNEVFRNRSVFPALDVEALHDVMASELRLLERYDEKITDLVFVLGKLKSEREELE
ncbi:hypothetical protein PM082_007091 [Marasmius tenuissimus]|nr:hypothetical protein PM082_007091 [Marasmius tenuissimus]